MDYEDTYDFGADPVSAKRRIMAQGVNILRSLIEAYNQGNLDDPHYTVMLCALFALVAEGKVKGHLDQDDGVTKWALDENYQKNLEAFRDTVLDSNITKGPWENSVDIRDKS